MALKVKSSNKQQLIEGVLYARIKTSALNNNNWTPFIFIAYDTKHPFGRDALVCWLDDFELQHINADFAEENYEALA
jgi:hypothetical protein